MAGEAEGEVIVPPTLRAVLATRLDQLEATERSVLERGSVEGEIFHRRAVQALAPEEIQLTSRLAALVRKGLIRPDRPQLAGEDAFRFRHLLLRDAAYEALPKAVRAHLHECFAAWLEAEAGGAELIELDELLGYHLEQTCRYRAELGLPFEDELAAAARRRLTAAGRRASLLQDFGAAVRLLERAIALVPPAQIDVAIETDLIDALLWAGKGSDALQRADSLAGRAAAAGDRVGELCGRIKEGTLRMYLQPAGATERLDALLKQALPVFERAADDVALYIGYSALGQLANTRAQIDAALEAYERAAAHARQAGLPHELLGWRAAYRLYGTTPVSELMAWLDENDPREGRDHRLRVHRARALAMLGRFDTARAILADTRAELAERGAGLQLALATGLLSVDVELWAGDPAAAAELGAEGCRLLEELGQGDLSTAAGKLAQALYALDRLEEADVWAARAELGASDDAAAQMFWRQVRAKLLARRGERSAAERLAREAVAFCEETDMLDAQGDAYSDLAEVLLLARKPDEATAALEQALARYRRKGNVVSTLRAQTRLAELQSDASLSTDVTQ